MKFGSTSIAGQIARGITERGMALRWATDMRPERSLSPERCSELVQGGALSAALGVESASPRVLSLIDKGIRVEDMRRVIENLSEAGMAVEAMCFSDFPTESYREALATLEPAPLPVGRGAVHGAHVALVRALRQRRVSRARAAG